MIGRRGLLAATGGVLAMPGIARAQALFNRPVRFVLGFAAGGADFLGHLLGRPGGPLVLALQAAAQIIDQDLGALLRGDQRALTSNTVAAARDEDNLAV